MTLPHPMIIDGGLSNEMESLGCDLNHPLWTAKYIKEDPEKVIQTHMNYLNAGADCISTFGYQASIKGLIENGYSHSESIDIIKKSVNLAISAKNKYLNQNNSNRKILIAASIGPYGAYLADGSEYRGDYKISEEELINFHSERLDILLNSDADIIAFETIPSLTEIKVINDLMKNASKICWVSLQCRNENQLADGTPIEKCISILESNDNIIAVGANCIAMEWVSVIIKKIKSVTKKRIIIYPNGGGYFDANTKEWKTPKTEISFQDSAHRWLNEGASIIGGCCRIGSADISKLVQSMNRG